MAQLLIMERYQHLSKLKIQTLVLIVGETRKYVAESGRVTGHVFH
jgi:hypothetical protein